MKSTNPIATHLPRYSSLQIGLTPRGRAVPILYGAGKLTSDIVWTQAFHYVPYQQNTGGGGGKGGGGGGGKSGSNGNTTYYYFAAILAAICEGPITALVAARDGSNWVYFNGNSPKPAWPVTSAWPSASPGTFAYEGYALAANLGAAGAIAAGGMMPYEAQQILPGELAWYEQSGMLDDNNNINPSNNKGFQQAGQLWQNIGPNSWATQAFSLQYGYANQPYMPYVAINFPGQELTYQYTAYWFSPMYQLGQSPSPPSVDWWVCGIGCYDPYGYGTGVPIVDAEPSVIITDLITNPIHGCVISGQFLDSGVTIANYKNYTRAGGLFLSVPVTSQVEARQIVDLIMKETVSVCFWSEGLMKIVPWYDLSITSQFPYGNVTFTPNLTPVYSVTDDQWQAQNNRGPLEVTRTSVFDTYNQLSLTFTNREVNYSSDIITIDDQANQETWGVRPAPPASSQYIADPSVAAASAQLQLAQLMYQRNTYGGNLPFTYCLIEPMDILLLNDLGLGVIGYPTRVQQITLNSKEQYQVTLANIVDEVYGIQVRNQQAGPGSGLPGNVPPGNVEPPFIFTGPVRLSQTSLTQVEIWCAVTGRQQGWGGCTVFLSTDGQTYEKTTTSWGGCRYGYLTQPCANFPGAPQANPDSVDNMIVQLIGPNSNLMSVNQTQAAAALTLSLVQTGTNFELLGYQNAILLNNNSTGRIYKLNKLYRGLDGSFGIAHQYGDNFARLDENIIKIPIDVSLIGTTVYLKFCSFNLIGGMSQGLSQVRAYPYTVTPGVDSPVGSQSLTVSTDGKYTILTWPEDPSKHILDYRIKYGPVGGTYQSAKLLIKVRTTHTVTLIVPPGTWVFYLVSVDKSGRESPVASVTATVPEQPFTLLEYNFGALVHPVDVGYVQYCDWLQGNGAVLTNCFVHPTVYVLCPPDSTLASFAGSDNGWEWVDQFCITPPSGQQSYQSPTIDMGAGLTNVRASAAISEYLWGTPLSPTQNAIVVNLAPDFAPSTGTITFTGCFVHPTAWGIVPTDSLAASFSGADNGWEVFDYTVYSPPTTSTVTYVIDAGVIVPEQATLITGALPGPNGTLPIVSCSILASEDNHYWSPVASSTALGTAQGTAIGRWFKYQVTIQNTSGQSQAFELDPGWSNVTLSGALIHPTSYALSPVDSVLASYAGATGFEVFDNFLVQPVLNSTATFVVNTGQTGNVTASMNTSFGSPPGQTYTPGNYSQLISSSPDGVNWTLVNSSTGGGQLTAAGAGQYWQFQIGLTNAVGNLATILSCGVKTTVANPTPGGGLGLLNLMTCEVNGNPSNYWTPVYPQIRTSPDNVNWSAWSPLSSTFTNQRYFQFLLQWTIVGAPWPFGPSSAWVLADASPLAQAGTATTVAGQVVVTFPTAYRGVPYCTATALQNGIVATVFSVTPTTLTIQTVASTTGAAANCAVNWTAYGV